MAEARQLRKRASRQPSEQRLQESVDSYEQVQDPTEGRQREFDRLEQFRRQQQRQQRQHRLQQQPSYLDSIAAPPATPAFGSSSSSDYAPKALSFTSIPSFSSAQDPQATEDPSRNGGEGDSTWLVALVLTAALLITIVSLIRSCCQIARGLPSFIGGGNDSQTGGRHHGIHGSGHGPGGGPSRYPGSGPQQVPGEDEPDPDQGLTEDDERWALLTDAQRQAYDSARAFQVAHPPLSVPTDISLSQYLSIQEKGVSAWEFEASYDNHRVQVHDRTELSFPPMNQLEASVQTNLPMPKQQEVYYWEVKMFEKSPDTVVAVGVSTKPYPNSRLPGWNRHSVAYHSKGQKFCNSAFSGLPYGPGFFEGDVVGCGYRPRNGTIFFTRNGKRIEDAYTGFRFNLFPTVGATGPCVLHVNFGQSGFVFVEANVKKWGLAPASGSLAPPPAYGSERGSILLEAGTTNTTTTMNTTTMVRGPAPPTRRPQLQSMQSRARIEAAGVLVQIEEDEVAGESGSSDYGNGRKMNVIVPQQHISLANMSAPTNHQGLPPPPHYSSLVDSNNVGGTPTTTGRTRSHSESDEETTALIAETISRPRGGRGRSGTTTSVASASGNRR
ncbi:Rsp5p-dependent ubiquitination, sorting of cargo proteins at the multivesicular body [Mortierella sp. GBA30]|nr:Rsp5p-dependent ubiquitination, sorting of cargo proteins at the multivesicular body [Mortierella sp. GBA30]